MGAAFGWRRRPPLRGTGLEALPDHVCGGLLEACELRDLGSLAALNRGWCGLVEGPCAAEAWAAGLAAACPWLRPELTAGAKALLAGSALPLDSDEALLALGLADFGLGYAAPPPPPQLARDLWNGRRAALVQVVDRHCSIGNRFSAYDALLLRRHGHWVAVYSRDSAKHLSCMVRPDVLGPADAASRLRAVPADLAGARDLRAAVTTAAGIRVGEVVEMQYRFAPTSAFGWWRGQVHAVTGGCATIRFTHFGDDSVWAQEVVDLDAGLRTKESGHATGGLRRPSAAEGAQWAARQEHWQARGLGYRA